MSKIRARDLSMRPGNARGPVFERYEQFHEQFSSDLSYQEIGRLLGVSRQRVHQIYQRYFRGKFPHREGYIRVKHITRQRHRKRFGEYLLRTPPLKDLYLECTTRGIVLDPLHSPHPNKPLNLLANGKRIKLHVVKCAYTFTTRLKPYAHVSCSIKWLRVCNYILILDIAFGEPRYFIIPSRDLLTSIHKRRCRTYPRRISIYIPEKRTLFRHQGNKPVINIWQYESRWDFLLSPQPPYGFPEGSSAPGVLLHSEV